MRNTSLKLLKSTLVVLFLFCFIPFSKAQDYKPVEVGASFCYWMSGDISISGFDVEKEGSLFLRAFADYYIVEKFAMGAYINKSITMGLDDFYDGKSNWIEFGMSFKPRIPLQSNMSLKPGLNIGYRTINFPDYKEIKVDGLGVNLSVELQFHLETKGMISGELGFLSQPAGGNNYDDVQWAPIFYLGVGYTL